MTKDMWKVTQRGCDVYALTVFTSESDVDVTIVSSYAVKVGGRALSKNELQLKLADGQCIRSS